MISRKELKDLSKQQLKGQWTTVVLVTLAFGVIQIIANRLDMSYESSMLFTILSLFISVTISIFSFQLYLKLTRGVRIKFTDMFVKGSTFLKAIGVSVIQGLIVLPAIIIECILAVIIGFALAGSFGFFEKLVIPGNIEDFVSMIDFGMLFKAFIIFLVIFFILSIPILILSYYLYPAVILMIEDESRGVGECISTSFRLMKGNLWRFIVLQLSFIGWGLLCILTLGIGYLWLSPYMNTVNMNFFNNIVGYLPSKENGEELIF